MAAWSAAADPETREAFFQRRLAATGLPKRYCRIPANTELLRCVYDDMGLYVIGDVGRGKTYLASSIVVACAEVGRDAAFVTMPDLFSQLKATYDGDGREDDIIGRYGSCGLLVIDDLGKGSSSAWELERTFQLVNRRYESELPTVVTTQYGRSELAQRLAGRGDIETAKAIISRLAQTTRTIRLDGPDRRTQRR